MKEKLKTLYRVLEKELREKIISGIYQAGSRLPSEQELVEQYNVSRITVRNAMDMLVKDGYITRIRGKGSYVSQTVPTVTKSNVNSFDKEIQFGIIVPKLIDVHTTKIVQAIVDFFSENNCSAIIKFSNHDQELEKAAIKSLLAQGVSGLIIYPAQNENYNEEIMQLVLNKFPLVLLDRELIGLNTSSVITDNRTAVIEAVNYLISLGHSRIGMASQQLSAAITLLERYNGYIQAHTLANIKLDGSLQYIESASYHTDFSSDATILPKKRNSFKDFIKLQSDMTALICFDPIMGALAFEIYEELGIKIPEDVSIIQFDEIMDSEFVHIAPTHIEQDSILMGKVAAQFIMDMIDEPDTCTTPKKMRLPATLIKHKSTAQVRNNK